MSNLDLLIPNGPKDTDYWTWATITTIGPLRVRLDGDDSPLDVTPECLLSDPQPGQRVYVQRMGRRTIVHGASGGPTESGGASLHGNPDFETSDGANWITDWTRYWADATTKFTLDTSTYIAGSQSVRIEMAQDKSGRLHSNNVFGVVPGALITIKFWAKSDKAGTQIEVGLLTDLSGNPDFYNGSSTLAWTRREITITTTWAEYTALITVPVGHTVARLDLNPMNTARTVWFDNTSTSMTEQTPDTGWITPALASGWSHPDARTAQYRKVAGRVYMRGWAAGGSGVIFTLPDGFRPESRVVNDHHFPVIANASMGGVWVTGTTGAVTFGFGSNAWVDLSPISFFAA